MEIVQLPPPRYFLVPPDVVFWEGAIDSEVKTEIGSIGQTREMNLKEVAVMVLLIAERPIGCPATLLPSTLLLVLFMSCFGFRAKLFPLFGFPFVSSCATFMYVV